MPLILSGGGDPQQVVPIDEYYASLLDLSKPVLYIPIAMEASQYTYDECFLWFTETYAPYGIEKAEMCTDLSGVKIDSRYSSVFIGGGNTFKLLKAIKNSDFEAQIKAFLENGGVVYGGSAGAIIFGRTIKTAEISLYPDENNVGLVYGGSAGAIIFGRTIKTAEISLYPDENNVGLTDLTGLNLCNNHDIICHYTEEVILPENYERALYVLYEDSGLLIDNNNVSVIGKEFIER